MSTFAAFTRLRLPTSSLLSASQSQCRRLAARQAATATPQMPVRFYAKPVKKQKGKEKDADEAPSGGKHAKKVATDSLIPASQRIVSSAEYKNAEAKMQAVLDWFRKEVAVLETRATGRVTPALLSPVRVMIPDTADRQGVRLEEVATVGVKEGTMLIITVFEEHVRTQSAVSLCYIMTSFFEHASVRGVYEQLLKYVEQAIYEAKLPSITPQKVDSRTIKIPIPKFVCSPCVDMTAYLRRLLPVTGLLWRRATRSTPPHRVRQRMYGCKYASTTKPC